MLAFRTTKCLVIDENTETVKNNVVFLQYYYIFFFEINQNIDFVYNLFRSKVDKTRKMFWICQRNFLSNMIRPIDSHTFYDWNILPKYTALIRLSVRKFPLFIDVKQSGKFNDVELVFSFKKHSPVLRS